MPGRDTPLTTLLDLRVGHGLEIGPLDRPIAVRPESDVSYLDVSDRSKLQAHYGPDDNVDVDKIPELDFWLEHDDGFRSLEDACSTGAPFDWVLASHVIEHIPDVIGWLRQLWQVTADDGELALSVPDRRFCFDLHRPATTVGQALEAHDRGDQTPSPRAVFDAHRGAVDVPAERAWAGDVPDATARSHTWDHALELLERCRRGEYVDSHVWLWTPREFVSFIDDLCHLGLVDFVVDRLLPTAHNDLEFHVVLVRLPAGMDGDARDERRGRAHGAALAALPPERTISTPEPAPDPDPVELLQAELVEARRQRDRARRRVRRLQDQLGDAGSARRAGALTRASRRLRRGAR
ncbi:methyltransferase domain-containing protein [Nocardioides sp.]|uniref:methyltransferase domain-containing protein n=1 Tax=Nocardioides sp. TaxID=35761 RepID=UPI002611666D|nr:methyltransferase domain-containing protein [Nocardioides sp.]